MEFYSASCCPISACTFDHSIWSLDHPCNAMQCNALYVINVACVDWVGRGKLKQTEMEFEWLKRWFGSLTEQNRRLQREVEQLRAMKVGPPTVMSPHSSEPLPASTLSMCPRCERVTTTVTTSVDNEATAAATLSPKVSTPALQSRQVWNALFGTFLSAPVHATYIN